MVVYDVSPPRRPDDRDDVTAEAHAILAIGKALSALDPETRLRVLRWANERFNAVAALEQPASMASSPARSADAMLSLEGVHALFEPSLTGSEANDAPHELAHDDYSDLFPAPVPRGRVELRVVARNDAAPKAVERELGDLHEPRLTHAESVSLEPLADLFECPHVAAVEADAASEAYYDIVEDTPAAVEMTPSEEQPLDTLVCDLATALRALTLQLEDATA